MKQFCESCEADRLSEVSEISDLLLEKVRASTCKLGQVHLIYEFMKNQSSHALLMYISINSDGDRLYLYTTVFELG